MLNATHLNLIPVLRNKYGVTEHSNTFGIDYGRITGCVVTVAEAPESVAAAMPVIMEECTLTTVDMERHGAHGLRVAVDQAGNVIKYRCEGF